MAVSYLTNGPAIINACIGKTASPAPLGMCRERIRVNFTRHIEPIKADSGGPRMGVDQQDMGREARISGTFSEVDPAVLEAIDNTNSPVIGQIGNIGLPLGLNNLAIKVQIQSLPAPYAALPYTFFTCILTRRGDAQGTEYTLIDFEFFAWANIGNAAVAVGTPLYVRALA